MLIIDFHAVISCWITIIISSKKTIVNVTSSVPATEILESRFGDRTILPLKFSLVSSVTISCSLITALLRSSLVPYHWKQAVVTPCQSEAVHRFITVSVLPILSKVQEWDVYNQIILHLNKYKLLTNLVFVLAISCKICYYMSLTSG